MLGSKQIEWFVPKHSEISVWAWVLQRLTGFFLLFLLGIHMIVIHFSGGGGEATFGAAVERVKSVTFFAIDGLLLSVGLYHGLNGIRTVILDLNLPKNFYKLLIIGLWVVGIGFWALGIAILIGVVMLP